MRHTCHNTLIKNQRIGLGDKTRRLVRGHTAATMMVALGCVGLNLYLINQFLGRVARNEDATPPPRKTKDDRSAREAFYERQLERRKHGFAPPDEEEDDDEQAA